MSWQSQRWLPHDLRLAAVSAHALVCSLRRLAARSLCARHDVDAPRVVRGGVVVQTFGGWGRRPCKAGARPLGAPAERWRHRGVVLVGTDTQDFSGDARAFARRFGLTYASVHDGQGSLMTRYGVTGMPE